MSDQGSLFDDDDGLGEFAAYADHARQLIPSGGVSWAGSPLGWMRHNSPRTKTKLAKEIVRLWLDSVRIRHRDSEPGAVWHLLIGDERAYVHLSTLGKNGRLEYSQLRSPGQGVDVMLLIGVEPFRARIWQVRPRSVSDLPGYREQKDGLHHCSFDPDDPPPWMVEVAKWNGGPNGEGPADTW